VLAVGQGQAAVADGHHALPQVQCAAKAHHPACKEVGHCGRIHHAVGAHPQAAAQAAPQGRFELSQLAGVNQVGAIAARGQAPGALLCFLHLVFILGHPQGAAMERVADAGMDLEKIAPQAKREQAQVQFFGGFIKRHQVAHAGCRDAGARRGAVDQANVHALFAQGQRARCPHDAGANHQNVVRPCHVSPGAAAAGGLRWRCG
jgi:hypothetical protein